MEFDPRLAAILGKAQAAASLLEVLSGFLDGLQGRAVHRAVSGVRDGTLTPEDAKALWIEFTAYQNVELELKHRVEAGRRVETRGQELQS